MRTAGIIGGIGPESTIDYYRQIVSVHRDRSPNGAYPSLLIRSIDLNRMIQLVREHRISELVELMTDELIKLSLGGADFAVMAASTPHVAFDEIRKQSPLPLVSIVDCAVRAVVVAGLGRVGVFGTRFTMMSHFYPDALGAAGAVPILPTREEQDEIHEIYANELLSGLVRYDARKRLLAIVSRMRRQEKVDGLILAGTELPLLIREPEYEGVILLDATKIHVDEIVSELLRASSRS